MNKTEQALFKSAFEIPEDVQAAAYTIRRWIDNQNMPNGMILGLRWGDTSQTGVVDMAARFAVIEERLQALEYMMHNP